MLNDRPQGWPVPGRGGLLFSFSSCRRVMTFTFLKLPFNNRKPLTSVLTADSLGNPLTQVTHASVLFDFLTTQQGHYNPSNREDL